MKVYTFYDSRTVDRYEDFTLFKNLEDAEAQKKSMGKDAHFYDIHAVELVE